MRRLNEYIREDHKFLVKSKSKEIKYKYFPKDKDELISIIETHIKEEGSKCDLNDIDVSEVTCMDFLFSYEYGFKSFNGDISRWDVSNVKNMAGMFWNSRFNGDISDWDVSNVQYMGNMFCASQFNGDVSDWDVHNVENMSFMFNSSKFNGDINNWDVHKVKYMSSVFSSSPLQNNPPKWYKK